MAMRPIHIRQESFEQDPMTKQTILYLPRPPSVNQLYVNASSRSRASHKGMGRMKSKAYKEWISEARVHLKRQKFHTFTGRVSVEYLLRVRDNRKCDCANFEKASSDFLTMMGILRDDSQIRDNRQKWMDEGCPWQDMKVIITELT